MMSSVDTRVDVSLYMLLRRRYFAARYVDAHATRAPLRLFIVAEALRDVMPRAAMYAAIR